MGTESIPHSNEVIYGSTRPNDRQYATDSEDDCWRLFLNLNLQGDGLSAVIQRNPPPSKLPPWHCNVTLCRA